MGDNERIDTNSEINESTEAQEVLGAMPSFREYTRRTKADRVQRLVDLAMSKSGNKGKGVSDALEEMDSETALNFLQHINSHLRNDKITKKSEVYGDETHRMMVGLDLMGGKKDLVAPDPELQKELFSEYFDAFKKIDDKDKKALLAYYAINNLHLFSDGNGRTSRTIYSLIKDGDLSDVNDLITHNNKIKIRFDNKSDGDDSSGRKNFISRNHIRPVEQINAAANMFLQGEMEEGEVLDAHFKGKHIYIYSVKGKNGLAHVMMSKKNRQGLSEEELKCLDFAMSDGVGGGGYSTLSGLTMAVMLQEKGLSKKIADAASKDDGRLPIRINFDQDDNQDSIEDIKNTFVDWTTDDYRKTLEIYREIKREQNRLIIKFFTKDLKWDDGKNVADWAMGKE